ncbi:8-oxoguanine deaminase [Thiofilum flexile]|uniref:8-oxoguanine deaminase n=1 Tax=Thiofilum flexile TaxID=125627 RepID=UPI0003682C3C|nr:8-oxoguanine deaminase [Thiofilum flexile]
MTTLWLRNPLALFDGLIERPSAGIVIQDQRIIEVLDAQQTPSTPIDQTFDASEYVILPGLINTHHHFYQTLTRAYPEALNKELFPWLKTLYPVWAGLEPEMLAVATELALTELMLSGCTTAADHHYLFPTGLEYAIDTQVEAAKKVGMRVTLTRGSMSLGKDQGGLPPQSTVQTELVILDDSERLIRTYHQPHEGAMVQIALAPCSPFSVTTELMQASAQLAQTYQVSLHTHLAETLDEEAFCLKRFGLRTVDYLDRVGWLYNRTWLAHGIHFNDEEIQRLGKAGVGICHCPNSNMMLASGICRTLELEQAGSPVGLGVDGSASNDHSNLISEVRQALYLQRLRYGAARMTHLDAYRFATSGSAKVLGRRDIGRIATGYQADLALFKLDELRFSGHHDPLAALLLGGAQRAYRVMIAGQWTVVEGAPIHIDIKELMQRHQAAARRLAQKARA